MTASGRLVLRGIAASHGVAVGPVTLLASSGDIVPRRRIDRAFVDAEVARLSRAIDASREEIESIRERTADGALADYRLVLDAHLLMHRDELIVDASIRAIRDERVNAEWALRRTVDRLVSQMRDAESSYFRERAEDVEHVGRHILRWLTGTSSALPPMSDPTVLVAEDVSPADAARLVGRPVLALATDQGSATSHTALISRALSIPAVVGLGELTTRVGDGDVLIVDALRGEVVLAADDEERDAAEARGRRYYDFTAELSQQPDVPARTTDGVEIELLANLDLPVEAHLALGERARGVGLYRTELLYLDRTELPSEQEQAQVYQDVVDAVAPRPVTFRTFDLGGDKLPAREGFSRGRNPALGLRALRLSLRRPELLETQLRAILRASQRGPVRVMFPLVTTIGEFRKARALVLSLADELREEGVPVEPVPVGIMVEVPSAALMADLFAHECDFFSVGTNDLIQYTLAVDRQNPTVADLARSLDPAVLRLLDFTARAAREAQIPLSMCGDMAADPVALPVVLGLGYRTLSMPYGSLPLAREVARRLDMSRAQELARDALEAVDADAVEAAVREAFGADLSDLWLAEGR